MIRFIFFVWALCFFSVAARAWNDAGHMVVAQIAYERLEPAVRERVDELSKIGAEPENATFVTGACWPDDLKTVGIKTYNDWHFLDIPFSSDGTRLPAARAKINVVWAMNQCVFTLKKRAPDPRFPNVALRAVPDNEKARALRFLTHLVGDAHQPMHASSRFSRAHPKGDRGGNDFRLGETNLHAFWDEGGGLFNAAWVRPLRAENRAAVEKRAREIVRSHPPGIGARNQDFDQWISQSFLIAHTFAYDTPENRAPSAAYIQNVQKLSAKRVALAGYRLATLLNRIFQNE